MSGINLDLLNKSYFENILNWADENEISIDEKNLRLNVALSIQRFLEDKISKLDLSNLQFKTWPPGFERLKVEILDLSNNNLEELPIDLLSQMLPGLKILKIRGNCFNIKILPKSLLDISDLRAQPAVPKKKRKSIVQPFASPPTGIINGKYHTTPSGDHNISTWALRGDLKKEERLAAAHCILVFKLKGLTELNLSGQKLRSLPPGFFSIKNIVVLDLSNNLFKKIA